LGRDASDDGAHRACDALGLWCLSRVRVLAVPERIGTLRLSQVTNRLSPTPAHHLSCAQCVHDGACKKGVPRSVSCCRPIEWRFSRDFWFSEVLHENLRRSFWASRFGPVPPQGGPTRGPVSSAINQRLPLHGWLIPNIGSKRATDSRHRRDHKGSTAVYALGIFYDISLVL
jgi:hypothetical protein